MPVPASLSTTGDMPVPASLSTTGDMPVRALPTPFGCRQSSFDDTSHPPAKIHALTNESVGAEMGKGSGHEEGLGQVDNKLRCRSGEQGRACWEVLLLSDPLQTHLF